jgi:hypothetical protein
MSRKLTFTTAALDGRVHREEELTLARTLTQRSQQHSATTASLPVPETPDDAAVAAAMDGPHAVTLNSSSNRRRVALPDPLAFKYVY